ncbi:MAG: WD40 repeat domain-containing protein [Trebonia sp.]
MDNPIHLINVATGAELARLSGPECGVQSLAFSPDGKTLAASVCGNSLLTVPIWDMATRKGTHVLTRAGYPLVFSHDGTRIATGHSGSKGDKIQLWNVKTGEPTLTPAPGARRPARKVTQRRSTQPMAPSPQSTRAGMPSCGTTPAGR